MPPSLTLPGVAASNWPPRLHPAPPLRCPPAAALLLPSCQGPQLSLHRCADLPASVVIRVHTRTCPACRAHLAGPLRQPSQLTLRSPLWPGGLARWGPGSLSRSCSETRVPAPPSSRAGTTCSKPRGPQLQGRGSLRVPARATAASPQPQAHLSLPSTQPLPATILLPVLMPLSGQNPEPRPWTNGALGRATLSSRRRRRRVLLLGARLPRLPVTAVHAKCSALVKKLTEEATRSAWHESTPTGSSGPQGPAVISLSLSLVGQWQSQEGGQGPAGSYH